MKKMRGVVDPITLGFVIIAFGVGLAASSSPASKQQNEVVKTQVEAPVIADNRVILSK